MDKQKPTSFIEQAIKIKKANPGVGHYKEAENAYNKISKSFFSVKKRQ